MSTPKELGKLFCEAREKKGLTVGEVSAKSLIHLNVIKDIETGVYDRLGKPYLKSFIKKYAKFLEMNMEDVLKRYEKASSKVPDKGFTFTVKEKDDKNDKPFPVTDRKIQKALVIILSGIFVILVFIFIGKLRAGIGSKHNIVKIKKQITDTRPKIIEKQKKPANEVQVKKREKQINAEPAKEKKGLMLTLRARGKAWVQITEGDNLLYSGLLEENASKTWNTKGEINVWTGKAEMLDFIVNDHDLGKVASGVIRNIKVSPEGVKIGKTWAARVD